MTNEIAAEDFNTALSNRPHREFRMSGHAELANEKHVKWGAKSRGNLEGYRDPTSRKSQDNDFRAASIFRQLTTKLLSGVTTVSEPHNSPVRPGTTPLKAVHPEDLRTSLLRGSQLISGNLDTKLHHAGWGATNDAVPEPGCFSE
jgi:hypothetical protein